MVVEQMDKLACEQEEGDDPIAGLGLRCLQHDRLHHADAENHNGLVRSASFDGPPSACKRDEMSFKANRILSCTNCK
jgi:hypothetical protein